VHCKHCDYLLFNLTQPVCPECGRSFDIERYRFQLGDVSFNCPHCDQEYYGNDERGLPFPRQFTCVQCNQPVALQQMRVEPKHPDAVGVLGDLSPWDRHRKLGLWRAWWGSFTMILLRPSVFFSEHEGSSIKEAWLFATISAYVADIPGFVFQMVMFWIVGAVGGGMGGSPLLFLDPFTLAMTLLGPPLYTIVGAAIHTVLIQPALVLLGSEPRPMRFTMCIALYAMGPMALGAIPIMGDLVGAIWGIITLMVGVRVVHRTNRARAIISVVWPILLVLGVLCILAYSR
jgi:hypothetical protein